MDFENETYLGDGAYVSFDGACFWLRAPRENGDHLVAFDAGMLERLNAFADRFRQRPAALPQVARDALAAAYDVIKPHLETLIESHCRLDPETHEPRRETLDPDMKEEVEQIEKLLRQIEELLGP